MYEYKIIWEHVYKSEEALAGYASVGWRVEDGAFIKHGGEPNDHNVWFYAVLEREVPACE